MVYSGAINEMANHQGYYQSLVDQCMGKDTLATDEIGNFILLIEIFFISCKLDWFNIVNT